MNTEQELLKQADELGFDIDEEAPRMVALAVNQEIEDLEDIEPLYDNVFATNPHTVRDGTSPTKAKKLVETLREALRAVYSDEPETIVYDVGLAGRSDTTTPKHPDEWTVDYLYQCKRLYDLVTPGGIFSAEELLMSKRTYKHIEHELREKAPETLKIGLHDVLNTLYYVTPASDGMNHADDHRTTIREAFDGVEIQDRTKPRRTNSGEYLVVTDSEADDLWEQDLDNYLDECVLPDLPEQARWYFDEENWKRDARMDGRAHSLSRYDGNEDFETVDGETYYIYRQN